MRVVNIEYPPWWQRIVPGWKKRWTARIDNTLDLPDRPVDREAVDRHKKRMLEDQE